MCFSGSVLLETFDIQVVSYDGNLSGGWRLLWLLVGAPGCFVEPSRLQDFDILPLIRMVLLIVEDHDNHDHDHDEVSKILAWDFT